jgi:hypothetical protein
MASDTACTSTLVALAAGGAQQMRRIISGEIKFSVGMDNSCEIVSTANLA